MISKQQVEERRNAVNVLAKAIEQYTAPNAQVNYQQEAMKQLGFSQQDLEYTAEKPWAPPVKLSFEAGCLFGQDGKDFYQNG